MIIGVFIIFQKIPFAANYYFTLVKYVGSGYPKYAEPPDKFVL